MGVKFRKCPDGKKNNRTQKQPERQIYLIKKISLKIINKVKFLYFADPKYTDAIFSVLPARNTIILKPEYTCDEKLEIGQ